MRCLSCGVICSSISYRKAAKRSRISANPTGPAVTFLGIVLLIFIVWLCGQIVSRLSARKGSKKAAAPAAPAATAEEEGIGEEVRAAIIAAIAAYYADEEGTCEFKVKRIKRL